MGTTTTAVTTTTSLSHAISMIKNVARNTRIEEYLDEMLHHSCMERRSSSGNRRNKGEGYGTPLTRSETFVGWRSKESIVTIVESIESKTKKLITEKKGQQQQQQQHQG